LVSFFFRDRVRDATGFDAPSADVLRFSVDVRSIFGHIFSHKKK